MVGTKRRHEIEERQHAGGIKTLISLVVGIEYSLARLCGFISWIVLHRVLTSMLYPCKNPSVFYNTYYRTKHASQTQLHQITKSLPNICVQYDL